uniref:Thymidylate kinase n=1 Tax=Candidatus Kentrum eta TaxID=2126337 RepID=A0A450VUH0_9GAMM|nr:MAG: dTMP kinase [Candidatus Kentron sp. H]VFK04954.1 MAG: dTMP kinase [Candidatus Kentron sp. H]VFK08461.1 MAG: dTMP kinase [Candidatus Kentron sp. H]
MFITIEGMEGGGKSTSLPFIADLLRSAGKSVVITREPGGTEVGEALRGLLLNPRQTIELDTELLLIFAARAEHLAAVITPALQAGRWVVCSRSTDATYAYQGAGRGIPYARIAILEDWVQGGLRPDLTLILDIPAKEGLARVRQRGSTDRFEQEREEFFDRVRNAYLARAEAHPDRYHVIDARAPIETVRERIADVMLGVLSRATE